MSVPVSGTFYVTAVVDGENAVEYRIKPNIAAIKMDPNNIQSVAASFDFVKANGSVETPLSVYPRLRIYDKAGSVLLDNKITSASTGYSYLIPQGSYGTASSLNITIYSDNAHTNQLATVTLNIVRETPRYAGIMGEWNAGLILNNGNYILIDGVVYVWSNPIPGNSSVPPLNDIQNNPNTTSWVAYEYWPLIGTDFLLARRIKSEEIDVDSLIAKLLKTNSEGPRVEIAGSLIEVFGDFASPNIRFGVNASGYAVLTYYDNNGNKLYDLGPQGIDWGSIVQPSWSTTKLTPVSALQPGDVYPDWYDVATSHQGYVPVNSITTNSGNTYYKYYAGSNPTITQEQRDQEKYLHVTNSLTSDTIQDGWYNGSVNAPMQYIGNNTGQYIKPAADGIYPNANGVLDIEGTIKYRRLVEYKNGYATGRVVMVFWNDGEFV